MRSTSGAQALATGADDQQKPTEDDPPSQAAGKAEHAMDCYGLTVEVRHEPGA